MNVSCRFALAAALLLGARQEQERPDAEDLKALRAAFEAGKELASARVRAAKEAVASELREESERDARIERALKDLTTRTPLRVPLSETLILDGVRVTGYFAGRVTLTWPQGEVEYPLELLPDETRGLLVGVALAKATPRDHFEMGKRLVRGKDFERAARCFATAGQRDPALAPFAPDLERVKRAARLFEGSFKAAGNTLSLRWAFSSPAEGNDFLAIQGTAAARPGQGLEVDGPKIAVVAVKEIPFRDRVRVSALARETDSAAHLMGIRFVKPDGGEVLIYGALATLSKTFLVARVEDGKSQELMAPTAGAAGNRLTMDFNRGRFVFQIGDKTVWSGNEGGFTDVLVVVGALPLSKPGGQTRALAQFKEVTLQGGVNPQWMAKKTAGLRDALASELSKEHRAKGNGSDSISLDLSVDLLLARAPETVRDAYKAALAKIATMRKTLLRDDLALAQTALEEMAAAHPLFAPAWYYRGVLAETTGDRRAAADHYDKALLLLPDFPEALCARSRLHGLAGRWDPARECIDQALALKPDFADALLLRARLLWETRDAAGVIETTQIARRLAPGDPDIQSDAQMLANVARGPRWPKPNSHATAHYAVRSDLPAVKCRLYAEHLEGVRPHYEEVLGRAVPAVKPAEVLIFESEEGYFIYNDFTAGSRQEHTLGAFSPWHGQMALFEGVEAPETLGVLAHEGFHQFLHALAPDVPIWFNEGMAEYVGAARVEKGKIVERGGIQPGRLDNLKLAVKYGWQPIPFAKIMLEPQAEFYGEHAPFRYAQAWSMIRYFMDGEGGRWKSVLKEYTERVLAGDTARSAFDATFGKQDQKALEAGWLKHYGLVVSAKAAKAPGPAAPPAAVPVDLMPLLPVREMPARGWVLKDKVLESTQNSSGLNLGYEPPAEYDWHLTVQRMLGFRALIIGLQGGGSTFVLRLDDRGATGLDAVDGMGSGNPTFIQGRPAFPLTKSVSIVCSVRKTGVAVKLDGSLHFDWKGDFRRLSYPGVPGMAAPLKNLFLWTMGDVFRITEMSVKAAASEPDGPPAEKAPPPKITVNAARSIALDCDISRWIVDGDRRQILALDPSGKLLQVSMAEMKVVRRIPTGGEPVALCMIPGSPTAVWVATQGSSQALVKLDLDKGVTIDTIPAQFLPVAIVAFRKYVFYAAANRGGVWGVDSSDKKDLGRLADDSFNAMAYDSRKDRLWGLGDGYLAELDASKVGVTMRELTRKNLGPKERQELGTSLNGQIKRHPLAGQAARTFWSRFLFDDKNGRIYFSNCVAKVDKPEVTLGTFKGPAHSIDQDPAVAEFSNRIRGMDQILAASPDGKWVASGMQIFSAATFAVHKEIPLPTPLVAFSKDSKELCYFDWVNRVIAVMDVEGK